VPRSRGWDDFHLEGKRERGRGELSLDDYVALSTPEPGQGRGVSKKGRTNTLGPLDAVNAREQQSAGHV
jgi:hypothetical protein